jgi:hypothetical protein
MSNDTRNYYERELDKIDFNGEHPAKILIGSEGKTTRALDINKESAVALIHRLTDFLLTPAPAPEAKEESAAPALSRPHVNYKTGRDRNGNKTLRCSSVDGGFTIQTNGNLPRTHRCGVTVETDAEVCAYVRRHGTDRRRRILGI